MTEYRERLWPAPWIYLGTALVIPASILVFLPINLLAGIVTAVVLYGGCLALLAYGAPTITVAAGVLQAGRARLPLSVVGSVEAFEGEEARQERGPRLDARAWLLIRGWVDPVVRVGLEDPDDPTPYWLVSTRGPRELAEAIEAARAD